jgi:HSP20 family protein
MITNLAPIERFRSFEHFNKMMEEMLSGWTSTWTPMVDVKETEKELTFICELPGMTEKDVNVEVRENLLTISGKREFVDETKKKDYVRVERSYGSFFRSFTLDSMVKPEKIQATFKDGLLTVVVPKIEAPKPKKIPVLPG